MAVRRTSGSLVVPAVFVVGLLCAWPLLPAETTAGKTPRAAVVPPASSLSFEQVSANASRAREAGAADEAVRWYRRGVRMRPRWDEGSWYLATLLYELDRYPEARDAFQRFLALKPQPGPGWALRGLCEFELTEYAASLAHLSKWLAEGALGNDETRRVALYHLSLLRVRGGQFELALEPVTLLCRYGPETPQLVRLAGLMLLRRKSFPDEVAEKDQELVDLAGRASFSWLAQRVEEAQARFKELIARYPDAPNAHYCYGLFLRSQGSDEALAEFQRELAVQPASVYPRLELAFELIKRGDHAAAQPFAEESVKLAPGLFAAHNALGRILVELGQLPRGISELQEAARLAPDSPEMYFALARAYARAGRQAEAEQARLTFQRLTQARRAKDKPGMVRSDAATPGPSSTP